jgi:hypothetical protein
MPPGESAARPGFGGKGIGDGIRVGGDDDNIKDMADFDRRRNGDADKARQAASAAKRDKQWRTLATAFSNEVDVYDTTRTAFQHQVAVASLPTGNVTEEQYQETLQAQNDYTNEDKQAIDAAVIQARGYEATIRAECRRAAAK